MAVDMQPKGSWILKILVVILLIFMLVSIHYPKKLWDKQEKLIVDSRERMENLNFVVQRYRSVKGFYQADIDSLLEFIRTDSIELRRPIFEIERLSLFDADNDSFLIGFIDRYHYEKIETEPVSEDSIVLSMIPKPIFADVVKPVFMAMASQRGIKDSLRGKGDEDIYHLIWSRGKITRYDIPYDTLLVASEKYLLFRKMEDLDSDPITGERFDLGLKTRVKIEGKVNYSMLKSGDPDPPLLSNELMANLLINKLGRTARAKVDALLKKDTTLYAQQLSLQSDFFEVELAGLLPGKTIEIESDREIVTPIDSVDAYRDPARIKMSLFHTVYDSLIRVWSQWHQTVDAFNMMTYEEGYELVKADTIGVAIRPPFGDDYQLPPKGILDRIFNVGPMKNPGFVDNNDLSWEEKR